MNLSSAYSIRQFVINRYSHFHYLHIFTATEHCSLKIIHLFYSSKRLLVICIYGNNEHKNLFLLFELTVSSHNTPPSQNYVLLRIIEFLLRYCTTTILIQFATFLIKSNQIMALWLLLFGKMY